ncbi:MAG: hypothetical protein ACOX4H_01560 [Bacillota bacterium]
MPSMRADRLPGPDIHPGNAAGNARTKKADPLTRAPANEIRHSAIEARYG